jgi:hypothetical protein
MPIEAILLPLAAEAALALGAIGPAPVGVMVPRRVMPLSSVR